MNFFPSNEFNYLNIFLQNDKLFICFFDTIPGIFGRVSKENYYKINKIKRRVQEKDLIIFFSDINQVLKYFNLESFEISILNKLTKYHTSFKISKTKLKKEYLENLYSLSDSLIIRIFFPRKWFFSQRTSGILWEVDEKYKFLLLENFGPFYTSSCNYEGEKFRNCLRTANNFAKENFIYCAKRFFGLRFRWKPSTIIDLENNCSVIRKGKYFNKIVKKINNI